MRGYVWAQCANMTRMSMGTRFISKNVDEQYQHQQTEATAKHYRQTWPWRSLRPHLPTTSCGSNAHSPCGVSVHGARCIATCGTACRFCWSILWWSAQNFSRSVSSAQCNEPSCLWPAVPANNRQPANNRCATHQAGVEAGRGCEAG